MKKLVSIMLFVSFSITILHAVSTHELRLNLNSELQLGDKTKYSKYKLSSFDRTISISQIERGSYVMIFDSSGRNVYKQIAISSILSIPVNARGIYIVRIQQRTNIFTERIFVQ